MAALDSNQEAARMWEQVRQEKAAGCYPWTHLTHNEDEEVWIDPLSLPQDLSREAILRRDGTVPSEWFHLPEGAAAPTVEEMLREDSPECEDEEEAEPAEVGMEEELEREVERRKRTPSGRRTPVCGRHRHRHKSGKSSTGSSPAPSHRYELRQPPSPLPPPPPAFDDGGYEPVGEPGVSLFHCDRPETRSPQSRLPTLPSGDETDTATQSCFPLRKPRSRSKDKKQKKNSGAEERSRSLESGCSEHNYETPKLLQKSPKASPPQVDRKKKPDSRKKGRSDQEDGYEPVGKAPLNMETWIAEKNNEFNAIMVSDADTRNINRKAKKESKIATVPHVNMEVVGGNKNNEMENVELIHLQRSLSEKSFKSNSSEKSSSKEKKRIKEEEKEKERLAKQEEKRKKKEEKKMEEKAKVEKQKEMKRLKTEEKEQKRKEEAEIKKLQKQEEEKLKQRQEEEKKKKVEEEKREKREKERQLEEERRAKIEKDKIERLKKEEEEKALQKKQEEERMRMKEQREEEKRKQKQLEEERKQLREKEKQEEKERKALAKIEKERQAKELKALMDAQKAEKEIPETDLEYADEEDTRVTSSVRHPSVIEEEKEPPSTPETSRSSIEPEYEPVGAAGPSTSEMALHRLPAAEDDKYVSVVGRDELASFQRNGHNGDEFGDEDIDFTPQNGYVEPEGMEYEEVGQGRKLKNPKKGKQQPALMGKIAAAGSAIKKARLPTPMELKEGYLNSAFHKSLHQPLIVKSKVEKEDVRVARQALTQEKSPTALGNINSVSDIPIPKVFASKPAEDGEEPAEAKPMPRNMDEWGQAAYNTLPKSFREQNIVTAVKENLDPEELARNQELTRSKTPAELAQIHSLSEFPVPENIKKFLTSERKADNTKKEPKKRRHSVTEPEGPPEPFSLYSTLPRSMRETKLVTNVKVEEDEEVLRARQELVQTRTPAQLSAITSISDLPVPSKLTKMMGSRESSAHGPRPASVAASVAGEKQTSRTPSKMNVNDMYSTLPKSLTMELAVKTKINDPAVVEERRKLTAEHTPMELGNIGSLADFPIPTPISNLFNKPAADTPEKPKRKKNMEEKRKRNLTTGTFLSSDFLPQSWLDTKLVCRTKVEEDPEVLAKRQEMVAGKSVSELSKMSGLDDFPLPTRVETLVRKKRVLKSTDEKENVKKGVSRSVTSLSAKSITSLSIPESLLTPLAVKSVVEDQDLVAKNKEIIKTKSVGELSHIGALSDFPIPDNVENLYNKLTATSSKRPAPAVPTERPSSPQSFKETIYETLPRSMRETQLITNSKFEEDEERLKERQELTRTKSPTELSQISSMSDFPIPTPVENLLKKKSEQTDTASPPVPPRKKEGIYDSIPASLKSELMVKTVEQNQELVAERQETIRTHTPAQLSEIHSLSDVPIPSFIQNLTASKKNLDEPITEKPKMDTEEKEKGPFKIYDTLPASLTETKLMTKSVVEEPEVQAARAEVVKSKSVAELSQITTISDFPVPETIENLFSNKTVDRKQYAPAERRKKIKEQTKSKSTQSLSQGMYASLPRHFTMELAVKTVEQEPDLVAERRELLASKSVSELSQVKSLADFPVPDIVQRAFHKSVGSLSGNKAAQDPSKASAARPVTPGSTNENGIYATLPKSLKAELLVGSIVEDPEVVAQRRQIASSKSVSELSQVRSLSDFPIPENLERLMSRSATNHAEPAEQSSRPPTSLSGKGLQAEIYASLPRSLTEQQLLVRTKVEESAEVLQARQALVESKSPLELSEIHSLAEMPIPSRIEAWLHGEATASQEGVGGDSPLAMPRNTKELGEALYRGLPSSLTAPVVVRSKVEDPTVLIERQQLQQTKSIHELSKIRNLNELPIPGNVIRMPDVPLPKMKSILNVIARPPPRSSPRRTPKSETYKSFDPESGTVESTPLMDDRQLHSPDCPSEDRYEEISTSRTEEMDDLPPPPPPVEEEVEEEDQFSLADQIRATPERSLKKEKKKKNRRSTDSEALSADSGRMEEDEIPPPLPPKRITPSPKKGLSLETQPSLDEEEEAVPVKGILSLQAVDGNIRVVRNEIQNSQGEQPQAPRREKQSQPREMTEKEMTLGSSELLYVAGSYLPITIEEEEEEEEYREEPPKPPPRVPKIPACHSAEPKISFSYTHDPRLTPTRKVSSQSQASLSAEGPTKLAASTRSLNSLAPPSPKYSSSTPQTLPRRKRARKDEDEGKDSLQPVLTPRQKKRMEADPTPPPRAKSVEIKLPLSFPHDSPSEVQKDELVETTKEFTKVEETSPRLLAPPRRYATIPRRVKGEGRATSDPVQSRPLPNPPAPPRLKKNKSVDSEGRSSRASGTGSPSCYRDAADATYTETANFQSCKDTLHTNASKTLVDSANRPHSSLSADVTLADSCVDSLVSCAETLVGDSDPNLETCAETLRDEDQTEFFSDDDLDNPYPAVDFDQMMAQGPGAGAQIIDRPGRSSVKKSESGRRLQEGTEQLSMELMEHVESLKTTLDNMSSRLGTRSRSRSHSKSRHSSQYRPSEQ